MPVTGKEQRLTEGWGTTGSPGERSNWMCRRQHKAEDENTKLKGFVSD
jgi:hypothetical protein